MSVAPTVFLMAGCSLQSTADPTSDPVLGVEACFLVGDGDAGTGGGDMGAGSVGGGGRPGWPGRGDEPDAASCIGCGDAGFADAGLSRAGWGSRMATPVRSIAPLRMTYGAPIQVQVETMGLDTSSIQFMILEDEVEGPCGGSTPIVAQGNLLSGRLLVSPCSEPSRVRALGLKLVRGNDYSVVVSCPGVVSVCSEDCWLEQ